MVEKSPKHRRSIFKEIEELFKKDILTYCLSNKGMLEYSQAYLIIKTLLDGLDTDRGEIRCRLGEEFEQWFYETHDKIINQVFELPKIGGIK